MFEPQNFTPKEGAGGKHYFFRGEKNQDFKVFNVTLRFFNVFFCKRFKYFYRDFVISFLLSWMENILCSGFFTGFSSILRGFNFFKKKVAWASFRDIPRHFGQNLFKVFLRSFLVL